MLYASLIYFRRIFGTLLYGNKLFTQMIVSFIQKSYVVFFFFFFLSDGYSCLSRVFGGVPALNQRTINNVSKNNISKTIGKLFAVTIRPLFLCC